MSEQQTEKSPARNVVIVGAGMAGVQSAVALREAGFTGPVTLIGAEPHQPYDRPPLSEAVLLGKAEDSAFDVDFEALDITLRLGLDVTALRAAAHVLDTAEGPVPYDSLVLATGAEPIALPGTEGVPGVHLLRTLGRHAPGLDLVRYAASLGSRRPWFAIGGIDAGNLDQVLDAGARRVVVVRAITEADDPAAATAELARRVREHTV
ncbi:Thiamine-phosphate synthase [Streptomyces badius]